LVSAENISLRTVAPSSFLPALVYEIGNGAIAPVMALTALDLGASSSTAGYTLALLGVGQVLGNVPSSSLATRLGDRRAMIVAALIATMALLACRLASTVPVLGAAILVLGMCNATFYLARQAYLTEVVPVHLRARALSTLGGSHRIGLFIGPFIGAVAISVGGLRSAYLVAMITSVLVAVLLFVVPDVPHARTATSSQAASHIQRETLRTHRRLYATLGLAVLAVAAVRGARQTVVPLWGHHIGLSLEQNSLIFGIAGGVDMLLFYPAGKVMDRLGRMVIALPSMVILGISMMLVPATASSLTLTAAAIGMGIGNGIGSGIMMTLGADTAPAGNRIRFLSIWRLLSDTGTGAGPLLMSAVATVTTLALGIVSVGSIGLIAAAALARWVPRYSPYATRAMMRSREAPP
jgi:MFS family permease